MAASGCLRRPGEHRCLGLGCPGQHQPGQQRVAEPDRQTWLRPGGPLPTRPARRRTGLSPRRAGAVLAASAGAGRRASAGRRRPRAAAPPCQWGAPAVVMSQELGLSRSVTWSLSGDATGISAPRPRPTQPLGVRVTTVQPVPQLVSDVVMVGPVRITGEHLNHFLARCTPCLFSVFCLIPDARGERPAE